MHRAINKWASKVQRKELDRYFPSAHASSIPSIYYMAKPVLDKSERSDWLVLGQDFAVRNVSMETSKPAN